MLSKHCSDCKCSMTCHQQNRRMDEAFGTLRFFFFSHEKILCFLGIISTIVLPQRFSHLSMTAKIGDFFQVFHETKNAKITNQQREAKTETKTGFWMDFVSCL